MDKQQILRLNLLGVNTNQTTIDIFEELLRIAEHLYEELSIVEEDRMRVNLYRLRQPTN